MADDHIIHYKNTMAKHKETLVELETLLNQLDIASITDKNNFLVQENLSVQSELERMRNQYKKLQSECEDLKLALHAQLMSEKLTFVGTSKKRIQKLFRNTEKGATNHLERVEKELQGYIKTYEQKTHALTEELGNEYRDELVALKGRLKPDFVAAQQRLAEESNQVHERIESSYEGEQLKGIMPELLTQTVKRKGLEFKLGLNVLNKVGVLLILIAVVLAGQYTYNTFFGDYAKGITFYLIGIAFLGLGEFFNRKKYTALAMSLIGGGIGVLYSATFISTFYLNILTLLPALGISVVIAVVSIFIASTYRSQVLGALSLVGGYLPVFAYVVVESIDTLPILGAITYLMILNGVILALSLKYRWPVVVVIGFVFNIVSVNTLVVLLGHTLQGVLIALINFLTYLFIVIYRSVNRGEKISVWDVGMLSLNTLAHVGIIYTLLNITGPSLFNGLIALLFGAFYIALGIWVKNHGGQPKLVMLFFMLAGLFSILVVPLQLDYEWWFMGWLLEALLFVGWGLKEDVKTSRLCGWVLFGLSYLTFYVASSDLFSLSRNFPTLEDAKHLSLVLAAIGIVWLYRQSVGIDEGDYGKKVRGFRYLTLTYFLLYMTSSGILALGRLPLASPVSAVEMTSVLLVVVLATLRLGQQLKWSKWVQLSTYRLAAYAFVAFCIFNANFIYQSPIGGRWFIEILQIILQNAFAVYVINLLLKSPLLKIELSRRTTSYILAVYVLFSYYLNFFLRVTSEYDDLLLNSSLIVFSIAFIVIGFRRKDDAQRRVGLVIAFVATGKLLLWDSIQLPLGQKILSYFAFGISLIVISYVYQRINAKLISSEVRAEVSSEESAEKSTEISEESDD